MGKLNYFYYPDGTGKWVEGGDAVPEGMTRSWEKPKPSKEPVPTSSSAFDGANGSDQKISANESDEIKEMDSEKKKRGRQPGNN